MNTDALCPGCVAEHDRRYRPGSPTDQPAITSPEAAAELLMPMLARADREHCLTLNLDTKHRLIATTTVSIGSIDHTFMTPREVYRDAPSTTPQPSSSPTTTPPETPNPPATTNSSPPGSPAPATSSA